MRKIFTYPLVIVTAALVFYIGAGVNVVSCCCDACKSIGIEAVMAGDCCSREETETDACCSHEAESPESGCSDIPGHSDKSCCGLERVSFDWNSQNDAKPVVSLAPVAIDLVSGCPDDFLFLHFSLTGNIEGVRPNAPPPFSPRDYLSFLAVLLI
jgi:hypothetical protein